MKTNCQKLQEKVEELKKQGYEGISVFPEQGASLEDIAADALKMIEDFENGRTTEIFRAEPRNMPE